MRLSDARAVKASELERALAFHLRLAKLPAPELEYRFHDEREWRFDFAWPDLLVAVECEGGRYTRGRHVRPEGFQDDCEKYNEAAVRGWLVLRVTGEQINEGRAQDWIRAAVEHRQHIAKLTPVRFLGRAT